MNTLRLWQPQLFATLDNFDSLDMNMTNPTFCEILDVSTSINANKIIAFEEMSNCENVRYDNYKMYIGFILCIYLLL